MALDGDDELDVGLDVGLVVGLDDRDETGAGWEFPPLEHAVSAQPSRPTIATPRKDMGPVCPRPARAAARATECAAKPGGSARHD